LLLRFGIVSALRPDRRGAGERLVITGWRNLQRFAAEIGFVSTAKRQALLRLLNARTGRSLSKTGDIPEPDYLFEPVVRVEDAGEQPVYSIRVDSRCHSFVANGFVNHNTEARLSRLAMELLRDIDKETVDFEPNFDGEHMEPRVLPARFPNLLANGSDGIAVGMATKIPPHNLRELIDATIALIDNPDITIEKLMEHVPGPDFPTGALVVGREGIRQAYETGRGSLTLRARAFIEEGKGGKFRIVVTELPYQVNKSKLIERIAELVREKRLEGITDLRDESDRTGLRVVIELGRNANPNVLLNRLYKETQLQQSFGVIMLAIVGQRPRLLNLKEALQVYVDHQKEVIVRRSRFELDRAQARAHILQGLRIALDHIDAVIAIIRSSRTVDEAKQRLMRLDGVDERLLERADAPREGDGQVLSEKQAQAILDMRLQRLTGLEREKIEAEYEELLKEIEYLNAVLSSETMVLKVVKQELREIADRFGDARRTQIVAAEDEFEPEDLIDDAPMVILLTHAGYIKRAPLDAYRTQLRGGRGVTGITTRDEDFVEQIFVASTHQTLLFFTNRGRVFQLRVFEVPEASRTARGTAIVNLIQVDQGEKITTVLPVREFDPDRFLVMATRGGKVKKTSLGEFANVRRSGLIAISLAEGDELIGVRLTTGDDHILLATRGGQAICFPETDIRPMGRAASGVIGIRLAQDDVVIGMEIADPSADLLTVTSRGYGKRTPMTDYRIQGRGGSGIIAMRTTSKTGPLAAIRAVSPGNEVMLTTAQGIVIRQPVDGIPRHGRSTQGVMLIRLEPGDEFVSLARIIREDEQRSMLEE
ncbi:MAG: DNA gyrase subunit A, partial [Clostridia bacterium]|nr:DNA gyrase subunit A [Clostridia bacterium]